MEKNNDLSNAEGRTSSDVYEEIKPWHPWRMRLIFNYFDGMPLSIRVSYIPADGSVRHEVFFRPQVIDKLRRKSLRITEKFSRNSTRDIPVKVVRLSNSEFLETYEKLIKQASETNV